MGQIIIRYNENKSFTVPTVSQQERAEKCIEELAQTGKLRIEFKPKEGNVPVKGDTEITNPTDRAMIGIPDQAGMTITYNQHQEWSYEMAARDFMQNEFDGLNGTLDGIVLDIEKQPNGKYKVKLSSDSEYNYFWIQFMSASNKPTVNTAGGFGEGATMATRALLHAMAVDKVTFASGKWKLDYTREEGVPLDKALLMGTLYENEVPLKGNYVEFETANLNLVEAMIKAKDYFQHSENPDFKDLTFENDKIGYRVLPPDQKGNMYYIQRYGLKGEGELDGILNGLEIVFKEKLSRETLREIGIDDDVDRRGFTPDEIQKLSKYFAKSMTDEQLMQAVVDLERYMVTTVSGNNIQRIPEGRFLCGILDEASERGLKFDDNCKYVYLDGQESSEEILYLTNHGYVTVDVAMRAVLKYSAKEMYKKLHQAGQCEPTIQEQQKLHILSEAYNIINGGLPKEFIISDKVEENICCTDSNIYTIRRDYLESVDFVKLFDDFMCVAANGLSVGRANYGYNLTYLLESNTRELVIPETQEKLKVLLEKYNEIK